MNFHRVIFHIATDYIYCVFSITISLMLVQLIERFPRYYYAIERFPRLIHNRAISAIYFLITSFFLNIHSGFSFFLNERTLILFLLRVNVFLSLFYLVYIYIFIYLILYISEYKLAKQNFSLFDMYRLQCNNPPAF